jgi:hypothetical protein
MQKFVVSVYIPRAKVLQYENLQHVHLLEQRVNEIIFAKLQAHI